MGVKVTTPATRLTVPAAWLLTADTTSVSPSMSVSLDRIDAVRSVAVSSVTETESSLAVGQSLTQVMSTVT